MINVLYYMPRQEVAFLEKAGKIGGRELLPRCYFALFGTKHHIIPNNMLILFGIMDII